MEYFSVNPFAPDIYLSLLANKIKTHERSYLKALNAKPNELLFEQFIAWRETTADKETIMPNMVLSEKTLATIAEKLPETLKTLSAIKGVGPQKTAQYGPELIEMIRAYQQVLSGEEQEQGSLF